MLFNPASATYAEYWLNPFKAAAVSFALEAISTDVRNALLGFDFGSCNRLRRKLQHRCFLTFKQISQQHRLPIGKFQRIMMSV